ncbi:hypothetical protein CY34DRAFT_213136 [Suillus luteus UH-Slu-Lm8-n1]|uniref:Uncharacterized protein n=1 Tax=Suillus luteus UH-Slu-Lm8-n1 TaxID=930992 RepID=A0A0D0ABJ9_9AGAM|nr:hypothetical protein CY34DRAFT_213136 [Suillus luteus UH-Slu-Lm8-n1]
MDNLASRMWILLERGELLLREEMRLVHITRTPPADACSHYCSVGIGLQEADLTQGRFAVFDRLLISKHRLVISYCHKLPLVSYHGPSCVVQRFLEACTSVFTQSVMRVS